MRLVCAVTAALLLAAAPAIAQPSRTPPVPAPYQYQGTPATETHRYGSKVALVDGLSFGAMLVGVLIFASQISDDNVDDGDVTLGAVLMIGGAAGYLFGGPLVHNSQGNSWGAWKSFGLRLGLPVLGAAIGEAMRDDDCEFDCNEDAGASLSSIGVLSAMVVDWFVLAKVDRPVARYAPYATTNRDGDVTFGLAGSF